MPLVVSGDVFDGAAVFEAAVVGAVLDVVVGVVLGAVVDGVPVDVVPAAVVLGLVLGPVVGLVVLGGVLGVGVLVVGLLTFAVVGVARLCGAVTLGVLVAGPPPVSGALRLSGPPLPLFGANAIGALPEVLPPGVVLTDGDPVEVGLTPGPLPVPPCAGASVGGAYEERLTSLDDGV